MNTFVLFVIISMKVGNAGGQAITNAEFTSLDSCNIAGTKIVEYFNENKESRIFGAEKISYICVEK